MRNLCHSHFFDETEHLNVSFRLPTLILGLLSVLPSLIYSLTPPDTPKSALLTNLLALSFAFTALALLKLDGFKTGTILLAGLFFYDIWWVFGTNVVSSALLTNHLALKLNLSYFCVKMVKVATSLDAPIKILWPKSLLLSPKNGFTLLGLGDIVIPGPYLFYCSYFN